MDAFFLINKPIGLTSFDVIAILRKKLGIKRIGHAGTLDPLATGLLLIATGNYTKLLSYCLIKAKRYSFDISLDGISPSYDLGTEIQKLSPHDQELAKKTITLGLLEKTIKEKYVGKILQTPPKYSALKINGQKALLKVKGGEDFEMKSREVEIFDFTITRFEYPTLSCEATVSSGTYIRSLAYDIGQDMGTGGYISRLCRITLGNLSLDQSQELENFDVENTVKEKNIFPKEWFIPIENSTLQRLFHGQRVNEHFPFPENTPLFIEQDGKIVLICQYQNGILIPERRI